MPSRKKSVIEIASYLLDEPNAEELIRDTMGHEMIHYWLWELHKPYGHTAEFHAKMNEIGVSRYNSVPKHRPFKHCYVCSHCDQKIWVRKRLQGAACAACCNQHASGKYHKSFRLQLMPAEMAEKIQAAETVRVRMEEQHRVEEQVLAAERGRAAEAG